MIVEFFTERVEVGSHDVHVHMLGNLRVYTHDDRIMTVGLSFGERATMSDEEDSMAGETLTARELQAVTMLARDMTNDMIGEVMGVTGHVAKFHLRNASQKLGARSRTGIVIAALKKGYLQLKEIP